MRENATGRGHTVDLREVSDRRVDVFLRHHTVMNDGLVRIDVFQVGVECVDTLLQAFLKLIKLVGFDNAWHRIVWKQTVVVFAVLVDAEAHAVAGQLTVDCLTAIHQFVGQSACRGFNHRTCSLL